MTTRRPPGLMKFNSACFVVQELVGPKATPVPLHKESRLSGRAERDPYTVFHLVKKGFSTLDATREVARQLEIASSSITRYGLKDRYAYTSQCVAVRGDFRPHFWHSDIVLQQQGGSASGLQNGRNAGNRFRIHVISDANRIDDTALQCARNFFGRQRFGTVNGSEVGRHLLEGNFDVAASLVSSQSLGWRLSRLEKRLGSWSGAFFHPEVAFDCGMLVLQWQSYLWNRLLEEHPSPLPERLPMWRPEERERYLHLWNPGLLDARSLTLLHRFNRPTLVRPKNIVVEQGYKCWDIGFDLPSGSYATVILDGIFELSEPNRRND